MHRFGGGGALIASMGEWTDGKKAGWTDGWMDEPILIVSFD